MVDPTRPRRESQACAAADAGDGLGGDLSAAADQRAVSRTPDLPVFIAESGDRAAQPGVERGHHLRAAAAGLHVPGGGARLAQPLCAVVGAVEHAGQRLLRGGAGSRLARQQPEIFNTDQGAQFTSRAFTGVLEAADVAISMDGRGRALDNVFIERLWRSVKYENIYLQGYETAVELERGLASYFDFYCYERLHMALGLPNAVGSVLGGASACRERC